MTKMVAIFPLLLAISQVQAQTPPWTAASELPRRIDRATLSCPPQFSQALLARQAVQAGITGSVSFKVVATFDAEGKITRAKVLNRPASDDLYVAVRYFSERCTLKTKTAGVGTFDLVVDTGIEP